MRVLKQLLMRDKALDTPGLAPVPVIYKIPHSSEVKFCMTKYIYIYAFGRYFHI